MSRELPEGWEIKSLKSMLNLTTGFPFKSNQFNDDAKTGTPVVRIRDLTEQSPSIFTAEPFDMRYLVRHGDYLIGMDGEFSAIKWEGLDAALNQRVLKLSSASSELDSEFLYYRIQPELSMIQDRTGATTVKHLSTKDLLSLEISLPPLYEQRRIAEILSSVDEAIAATQAVIEQTKKVKQATLERLLTKGIGHARFKQTEIGEIPVEWQVLSFNDLLMSDDIIKIQDGNHGEIHPTTSDYQPTGIPFIMARDLIDGSVDINNCAFISKELAESLRVGKSYAGDILLTHKGTIGRLAITPDVADYIMLTPQVTLYRVKDDGAIISAYLRDVLENEPFQSALLKVSDQSTRKYVGITEQKKIKIPVPSIREQHQICKIAQDLRDIERGNSNLLDKLRKVKSALMSDLLTGRKRVTDTLPLAAE